MNTKGKLVSVIFVGGLLSLTAPPAHAHHAFSAEFDAEQPIELKGVVTKLELVNPHSWLYLDVKQTDGSAKNWGFEFGAPFSLKQKGITKASLPVGSEVTIQGYRAKNGKDFGYAVTTVLSDGRSVKTGGAQDAPDAQAQGKGQAQ
ncbi:MULTISPECIES: DUF6152 family protein [Methylomonas]|uniref:Uncharacterized protein n=2 Tax=Methylomonas TaxID=416 RepID=A0A140E3L0_9GAMM|nr:MULTISPECIES: DUF6152 family protein [Methylomonas]AMK74984.1 hypothetical protein JT25_000525 [Methylomonas denitrificans]OAI02482.1 hypothetical protein A1342_01525 [Methylomonas methanica]TCV83206.1 hypothetical protein EDE11_110165 [Methylomonas methanica]